MALEDRVGRSRTPASVLSQLAKIKSQQPFSIIWLLADRDTVITVVVIRWTTRLKKRVVAYLFN
jgi:hypothetical protein